MAHKEQIDFCKAVKRKFPQYFKNKTEIIELTELNNQIEESGVKLVEGYLDAPGHEFYLVLETDDHAKLNKAIEQLRLVGDTNKIVPIMKYSDAVEWAKNMGIQK